MVVVKVIAVSSKVAIFLAFSSLTSFTLSRANFVAIRDWLHVESPEAHVAVSSATKASRELTATMAIRESRSRAFDCIAKAAKESVSIKISRVTLGI